MVGRGEGTLSRLRTVSDVWHTEDKSLFEPQMSAKAAKLALDSITKRSTSQLLSADRLTMMVPCLVAVACEHTAESAGKKTSQVPVGNTRLANILADQCLSHFNQAAQYHWHTEMG